MMGQFAFGLIAGIVVGLVMEWVIDWTGLLPKRVAKEQRPQKSGKRIAPSLPARDETPVANHEADEE